jgi:hypothetical protein
MKCRFHVGVDLVPVEEHAPIFAVTGQQTEEDGTLPKRIALRCPLPRCPCVAIEYDENKTGSILCRRCNRTTVSDCGKICVGCRKALHKEATRRAANHARALHPKYA